MLMVEKVNKREICHSFKCSLSHFMQYSVAEIRRFFETVTRMWIITNHL